MGSSAALRLHSPQFSPELGLLRSHMFFLLSCGFRLGSPVPHTFKYPVAGHEKLPQDVKEYMMDEDPIHPRQALDP